MALTDRAILLLKPTSKDQFVADGDGLYLRVHKTGTKTFVYRSRVGGSASWTKVGVYPATSLKEARAKRDLIASGSVDSRKTVSECYTAWKLHIAKTYKSPAQVIKRMDLHVIPFLGSRPLIDLTRQTLSERLTKVAATAPVQANRTLGDIKQLLNYAVERGWIEASPAALLSKKTVGGKEKARTRVLNDDELVDLIRCIYTDRFALATRLALAICLLTGQRSGEVRGLKVKEFTPGLWLLPKERIKTEKDQRVYPGKLLTTLLKLAFKELGSSPFAGMEGPVLAHATRRMKFAVPFTPHDLRRTMATRMSELGVMPHVVEKCLNHKMVGVMAVYNHAEYAAEKAAAWRLWERHLIKLAKKAKKSPGTGAAGA